MSNQRTYELSTSIYSERLDFADITHADLDCASCAIILEHESRMIAALMGVPKNVLNTQEPSTAILTRKLIEDIEFRIEPYREWQRNYLSNLWSWENLVIKHAPFPFTISCCDLEDERRYHFDERTRSRLSGQARRASCNRRHAFLAGNKRRTAYWARVEARAWSKCMRLAP